MTPYSTSGQNRYCRLFEPCARQYSGQDAWMYYTPMLNELVECMEDDGSRPNNPRPDFGIQAGYTYFGQFVDHDLTNNPSSLPEAMKLEPEQIVNRSTPVLDLQHLYGGGPWDEKDFQLYEENDVRFKIGAKVDSVVDDSRGRRSFDVGLNADSYPLVADIRASENIILRQITAVFARLHNAAVEQFRPRIQDPLQLFTRARQQTVWQFQHLVCEDYLPAVLNAGIYRSVFVENRPMIRWDVFSTPIEFAVAGMRFGHSMVRNGYDLSNFTSKSVNEITERGIDSGALEPEWEVDWGRFFQNAGPGGPATSAQPIDTRISRALFNVSIVTLMLFNSGAGFREPNNGLAMASIRLPLITLLRGAAMRLPSGQDVARGFAEEVLGVDELTHDLNGNPTPDGEVLGQYEMMEKTPLWYYILKESEMRENGSRLGPTGSHIVAETIYAALRYDPSSFLNDPKAETTSLEWQFPSGQTQIKSLSALFEHASEF